MQKLTYSEKLKDPRWQKKRLEILKRDHFTCQICDDKTSTLHVHHSKYSREPWSAKAEDLTTLCEVCHKEIELAKNIVGHPVGGRDQRALVAIYEELPKDDKLLLLRTAHFIFSSPKYRTALRALDDFGFSCFTDGEKNAKKAADAR